MAQVGFTHALSALWDSRRQLPLSGATRTGIFPRLRLKLWDSKRHPADLTHTASKNDLKFLKRFRRGLFNSFGRTKDHALVLPPVGCQCPGFAFFLQPPLQLTLEQQRQ